MAPLGESRPANGVALGALKLLDDDGTSKHKYSIHKPTVSLGRALTNDVRLLLEDVSREHCRIEFSTDQQAVLRVTGTNGVWLNDVLVKPNENSVTLSDGDKLKISKHLMSFTYWKATTENEPLQNEYVDKESLKNGMKTFEHKSGASTSDTAPKDTQAPTYEAVDKPSEPLSELGNTLHQNPPYDINLLQTPSSKRRSRQAAPQTTPRRQSARLKARASLPNLQAIAQADASHVTLTHIKSMAPKDHQYENRENASLDSERSDQIPTAEQVNGAMSPVKPENATGHNSVHGAPEQLNAVRSSTETPHAACTPASASNQPPPTQRSEGDETLCFDDLEEAAIEAELTSPAAPRLPKSTPFPMPTKPLVWTPRSRKVSLRTVTLLKRSSQYPLIPLNEMQTHSSPDRMAPRTSTGSKDMDMSTVSTTSSMHTDFSSDEDEEIEVDQSLELMSPSHASSGYKKSPHTCEISKENVDVGNASPGEKSEMVQADGEMTKQDTSIMTQALENKFSMLPSGTPSTHEESKVQTTEPSFSATATTTGFLTPQPKKDHHPLRHRSSWQWLRSFVSPMMVARSGRSEDVETSDEYDPSTNQGSSTHPAIAKQSVMPLVETGVLTEDHSKPNYSLDTQKPHSACMSPTEPGEGMCNAPTLEDHTDAGTSTNAPLKITESNFSEPQNLMKEDVSSKEDATLCGPVEPNTPDMRMLKHVFSEPPQVPSVESMSDFRHLLYAYERKQAPSADISLGGAWHEFEKDQDANMSNKIEGAQSSAHIVSNTEQTSSAVFDKEILDRQCENFGNSLLQTTHVTKQEPIVPHTSQKSLPGNNAARKLSSRPVHKAQSTDTSINAQNVHINLRPKVSSEGVRTNVPSCTRPPTRIVSSNRTNPARQTMNTSTAAFSVDLTTKRTTQTLPKKEPYVPVRRQLPPRAAANGSRLSTQSTVTTRAPTRITKTVRQNKDALPNVNSVSTKPMVTGTRAAREPTGRAATRSTNQNCRNRP